MVPAGPENVQPGSGTDPVKSMDYEVIVIGGGPAGAAAARRLARRGRRVLLVERRRFPRFHIGESMLPASNAVFRQLGLTDAVAAAGFVRKRGASFTSDDGELGSYVDFTGCSDIPSPVTFQVPRARLDQILLDGAAEAGVEVRQEHRARDVAFAPDRVTVTVSDAAGETTTVDAEVLVDASGQAGFLARRLELRRHDPEMRHVALYAHFEGVPRPPGERSGDIRIVSRRDLGWIWFIPLSPTVTSVGVVMSRARHASRPREDAETLLDFLLASTPVAAEQVREARRVSPAHFEADFSYSARAYAGDRWLLAGDAGSFLDPVFSSGVLLALESGVEAADAIDRALAAGDVSARAFAAFQKVQRRRFKYFRRFARSFYDPWFRDVFMTPTRRLGLTEAIATALAGHWRPSFLNRLRLELFFAAVAVQRFVTLSPRRHGAPAVDERDVGC